MSIHISYHFGTELRDHLQTLAKQGDAAVNKAARAIGVYMLGEIQQHFDGQTLWDDSKMPPSKPNTV